MTSGAPEPAWAAFLNLFCASPKGTLTYLTSTFGCFFSKPSAIFLKTLSSLPTFEVSHQVTVPESSPELLLPPDSSSPPQAVAASARVATRAVAVMPRRI